MSIDWSRMASAEARATATLEAARAEARIALAATIAHARAQLITALPGQDMIYLAKEAEARAWIADPAPHPARHRHSGAAMC